MKSFADPDTHFEIIREEQEIGRGGLTALRPTGEVRCSACGKVAENVDDFPHAQDCPQRFVHSEWYAKQLQD